MDIDRIKADVQKRKAPEMGNTPYTAGRQKLDDMIVLLKKTDADEARKMRRLKLIFALLTIIYAGILILTFIYPPDTEPQQHRVTLGLATFLFASAAYFAVIQRRRLQRIDYSGSVRPFLIEAEKRLRFVNRRDGWVAIPYIFLSGVMAVLGWTSAFRRYLPNTEEWIAYLSIAVIGLCGGLAGYYFGKRSWESTKLPLLKEVRSILAELDADGSHS